MFTNERNSGDNFGREIETQLNDANCLEVASGYFAWRLLDQLKPKLLNIARRGHCKLLFGMIYHERSTPNQKECLINIHNELSEINDSSGVFVTLRPYHGKVYRLVKNERERIYVGSSNFSVYGFKRNMEFNLRITDPQERTATVDFLKFLFGPEGIKREISSSLSNVDLKLKSDSDKVVSGEKTLKDFQIDKNNFPSVSDTEFFKIRHRPNEQPRSSLNLYFDNGRKVNRNGKEVYTPRPWYEVEVTSQKTERDHKDYPKGEWIAYVEDSGKYYKLQMVTSSGDPNSPKAIQTSKSGGGRSVLGELIKGKMERCGVLNRYTAITDEILESYGKDYIELKKISDRAYLMKV